MVGEAAVGRFGMAARLTLSGERSLGGGGVECATMIASVLLLLALTTICRHVVINGTPVIKDGSIPKEMQW